MKTQQQTSLIAPEVDPPAPLPEPRPDAGAISMLEVIAAAARDPNVDVAKMDRLLEMKFRVEARDAEAEFNRDFAAAKTEMPRIVKRGVIDMGGKGKMPYAKYEDLNAAICPVEAKYGFARSFQSQPADNGIHMTVKLTHRAGHCVTSTRHMPPDPGPGRNAMQAIGSASSYAKRYLTLDIWDITTENEDDDAKAVGFISDAQVNVLVDMLNEATGYLDTPEKRTRMESNFLSAVKAERIGEIQKSNFETARTLLKNKIATLREGKTK